MPFHLKLHVGPFTPPERLHAHFQKYNAEHAARDGGTQQWAESVRVWKIESDMGDEAGYAWCWDRPDEKNSWDISIAVFDDFGRQGAGRAALKNFENEALRCGITVLCGQVNTNTTATGQLVRAWLLRKGFQEFDRLGSSPQWRALNDTEYSQRYPGPVRFRKWYFPNIEPMKRPIDPHSKFEDIHGSNAAVQCPMCFRIYVVSGLVDQSGRLCPKCEGSRATLKLHAKDSVEAYVEWPILPRTVNGPTDNASQD